MASMALTDVASEEMGIGPSRSPEVAPELKNLESKERIKI